VSVRPLVTAVNSGETADLIEMPFGGWLGGFKEPFWGNFLGWGNWELKCDV